MKVKILRRKGTDIGESGTLSDLAFLLIIFFIVIAVFNVNQGFLLGLPHSGSKRIVQKHDLLRVELTRRGELRIEGKPASIENLVARALALRQERPNMIVALQIDPETPYQWVVDVLDLMRRIDIDNFSFRMEAVP